MRHISWGYGCELAFGRGAHTDRGMKRATRDTRVNNDNYGWQLAMFDSVQTARVRMTQVDVDRTAVSDLWLAVLLNTASN